MSTTTLSLVDADALVCARLLEEGSKSFNAASRLLPGRLRGAVVTLYAFCRVADDMVDLAVDPAAGVARVSAMLDRIYADHPADEPVERAFSRLVHEYGIPRTLPAALVDGFAWDAEGRNYETVSDVCDYAARVASAVGVMMTLLMGTRDRETLARACDLGLAMQLTNIARDVGEDARLGRVYLPGAWLREAGLDRETLRRTPVHSEALGGVVRRLLDVADTCYARATVGIAGLPEDCRPAIHAAALIYADIGRVIRKRGGDTVTSRARTSALRKVWLAIRARWAARRPGMLGHAPKPADEILFLLDAVRAVRP